MGGKSQDMVALQAQAAEASVAARHQRMREAVAAYTARPVRQTLNAFRKMHGISIRTWYDWMLEDWFRDELKRANDARTTCGLDVFRQRLEEVNDQLVTDATTAPTARERTAAARVIHEVLHTIRPNNKVTVLNNQQQTQTVEKTEDELQAERAEILRLLKEAQDDAAATE